MSSAPYRSAASAAAALMLAGAGLGLAGCGREHAPETAPPPPAPVEQPLDGAPEPPPPPVAAPLVEEAPPTPPPAGADMEAPSAAPGIVAMAPIPNPPEEARAPRRYAHRYGRHVYAVSRPVMRQHRRHVRFANTTAPSPVRRMHARPAAHAATTAPTLRPAMHPAGPAHAPPHHPAAKTSTSAHRTHSAASAGATTTAGPRAERVAALQTALSSAVAGSAVLSAPHFSPGAPADVTLSVPAAFSETLRTEAGRQGLADDAASAALTARLSGDGYVVIPDAAQREVVMAGQPTVFHWTATQQAGAKGPLQAQVCAQLLGGGQDQLDLGVVKAAQAGGVGWKVVGAILLVLVLGLILALFARSGREKPAVVERRRDLSPQRPFDMNNDPPPPRT